MMVFSDSALQTYIPSDAHAFSDCPSDDPYIYSNRWGCDKIFILYMYS